MKNEEYRHKEKLEEEWRRDEIFAFLVTGFIASSKANPNNSFLHGLHIEKRSRERRDITPTQVTEGLEKLIEHAPYILDYIAYVAAVAHSAAGVTTKINLSMSTIKSVLRETTTMIDLFQQLSIHELKIIDNYQRGPLSTYVFTDKEARDPLYMREGLRKYISEKREYSR